MKKGIVLSAFKQLQQRQAKHAAVWLCRAKTGGATSSLCRATETGATKTVRHASSADRARNPGGSGFREEVARHNTPVAPSETALQAVFVAPVVLARQRRSVTPVARHRAQNPGGSGFREEVARHNTLVAPIEPALQAVLKLLVLQFDFICP